MIQRNIERDLPQIVEKSSPVIFTGPRFSGKTALLEKIAAYFEATHGRAPISFNFQKEGYHATDLHAVVLDRIRKRIDAQGGTPGKECVLLDNIDYIADPIFLVEELRKLFGNEMRIIATTSTRNYGMLPSYKKNHKDVLLFPLMPITWEEYLMYFIPNFPLQRLRESSIAEVRDIFISYQEEIDRRFSDFLRWGGFPRLVPMQEERFEEVENIFSSYIELDVTRILPRRSIGPYAQFLRLMAHHVGEPKHYSAMSKRLHIHKKTFEKFIRIAENTFMLYYLEPFWQNSKKEISARKQIYFVDQAPLQYFCTPDIVRVQPGYISKPMLKNVLVSELWKKVTVPLRYYRTIAKAEVDVLLGTDEGLLPVNLQYYKDGEKMSSALRHFMKKYGASVRGKPILLTEEHVAEYETHTVLPLPLFLLFDPHRFMN